MRVISTLLPAEVSPLTDGRAAVVMAFDTLVGDKSLVVGFTVGRVQGPDLAGVLVSPLGQEVINRASAHHQRNYPDGVVLIAGVAKVAGAKQRVRQVLAKAPPQALVLLLCADDKAYDAAYPALGVDLKAMDVGPQ